MFTVMAIQIFGEIKDNIKSSIRMEEENKWKREHPSSDSDNKPWTGY